MGFLLQTASLPRLLLLLLLLGGSLQTEVSEVDHEEVHDPLQAPEDGGGGDGPVEAPVPQLGPEPPELSLLDEEVELRRPLVVDRVEAAQQLVGQVHPTEDVDTEVVGHLESSQG